VFAAVRADGVQQNLLRAVVRLGKAVPDDEDRVGLLERRPCRLPLWCEQP
jgi:hypothetical protein